MEGELRDSSLSDPRFIGHTVLYCKKQGLHACGTARSPHAASIHVLTGPANVFSLDLTSTMEKLKGHSRFNLYTLTSLDTMYSPSNGHRQQMEPMPRRLINKLFTYTRGINRL